MTFTFGTQPSDVVMDAAGNVRSGIRLDVYPDRASAVAGSGAITALRNLSGTALPGYLTSDAKGRFAFTIDGDPRTRVAIKDPTGEVWELLAIEADDNQATLVAGKVPTSQLPSGVGSPTYRGSVASQSAMLALSSAVQGDWCNRSDVPGRFDLTGSTYSTLSHWTQNAGSGTDVEVVRDTIGSALVEAGAIDITINDAGDTITIGNVPLVLSKTGASFGIWIRTVAEGQPSTGVTDGDVLIMDAS